VEGGDTAASLPVIVEGGEDEGAEVEPSAGPKSSEKAASVDDTEAAVLVDFEHVDAATALSMLQSQPHSEVRGEPPGGVCQRSRPLMGVVVYLFCSAARCVPSQQGFTRAEFVSAMKLFAPVYVVVGGGRVVWSIFN